MLKNDHNVIYFFNFEVGDILPDTLLGLLRKVYKKLKGRPVKIRIRLGYLLLSQNDQLCYFYAGDNSDFFKDKPAFRLFDKKDFEKIAN